MAGRWQSEQGMRRETVSAVQGEVVIGSSAGVRLS